MMLVLTKVTVECIKGVKVTKMIDTHPTPPNNTRPIERLWPNATGIVRQEVAELAAEGLDIQLVASDYGAHFLLQPERQLEVTGAISALESMDGFAKDQLDLSPAGKAWLGMAKSSLALNAFYNISPTMDGPADGIDADILDRPLPISRNHKTPRDLVYEAQHMHPTRRRNPEAADAAAAHILAKCDNFLTAKGLWDAPDGQLSSGDFIAGSLDRIADVTRATLAMSMIREHVYGNYARYKSRGVTTASVACGAAEPMYWIARQLEADGVPVREIHNVDLDPIALAASLSRAEAYGMVDKVSLHYMNLVKTPITRDIEKRSCDFSEAIGLIEYLSQHNGPGYRTAGNLLVDVASTVRPGGMMLFGNMLESRSQQKWFDAIWPKLKQRSVREVISMLEEVGFSRDTITVRIAEGEGLYAMYGVRIPESGIIPTVSAAQRALGQLVTRRLPAY